jgi:hypothetical protein
VPLGAAAGPEAERTPRAWRTTIADVAADLDVIDLSVLVESWAGAVHEDWSGDPTIGKITEQFRPPAGDHHFPSLC